MSDPTLTPEDLERYMQAYGISGNLLRLEAPTPTVETAAQAVGTDSGEIVKSILFLVGDEPVLAITCGPDHVDRRSLAGLYGVGRKKVKLAEPERVLRETGYPVGGMPPFGHRKALPTLLDRRVLDKKTVFAGGGSDRTLIRISPDEILRAAGAKVIDLLVSQDTN